MSLPNLAIVLVVAACVHPGSGREHKVHNIVLYPERHSWCQTTAIKQVVASQGYEPVTIDNNVCVGACYSYSIPKTQPAEPGELIGPYCDSCQPVASRCYHVTLQADRKNAADGPRTTTTTTTQKRVQIIKECSCLTCELHAAGEAEDCSDTAELPSDMFATGDGGGGVAVDELPELLHLPEQQTTTTTKNRTVPEADGRATKAQRYELNAKLINLLKSIRSSREQERDQEQEDDDDDDDDKTPPNLSYNRAQLRELLEIIEGKENQLSDKNLMEFVNFVNVHNSEDLELDLSRLKEVLVAFQNDQALAEKHREFGLGQRVEGSRLGLGHLKGVHVAMGIVERHRAAGDAERVGDEEGHLVRGPHGSLAFAPDVNGVEAKLNIESDLVKPNHEGLVLNYENHPKNRRK